MRQIDDDSDTLEGRFHVLELNSTIGNLFRQKKRADNQLQALADTWNNWGWQVKYLLKIQCIIIYAKPTSHLSFMNSCQTEVKQLLSKLPPDGNINQDQQKWVFCGKMSYSTNTLRLSGHVYCRCALSHLTNTIQLQCPQPKCEMNINMHNLLEIFSQCKKLIQMCKKSIQIYLEKNSNVYDQRFCPNPICEG